MDISQLATDGAAALMQAMVSDLWQGVRPRFAALFGKGRDAVDEELEQVRAEIDEGAADSGDIEDEWAARLRRVLKRDPQAAEALRAIIDEVAPEQGPVYSSVNTISGHVHGNAVQIGHVHGNATTTHYGGDHVDLRGARAQGDVVGRRHGRGPRREG
ncbi:hypothetical protein J0910_07175 [Nocardiopsis sp. CNT-189]|uniref:hypothetical protein n=1 Tax=Nocardiopsis oceanisediminis TaxID=2816862 RepID=UPI003B30D7AA